MKVLKFGGTSVGSTEALRCVKQIVEDTPGRVVVVASALSGMTDSLLRLAEETGSDIEAYLRIYEERFMNLAADLLPIEAATRVGSAIGALTARLDEAVNSPANNLEEQVRRADAIVAFGELMSTTLLNYILDDSTLIDARKIIFTDESRRKLDFNKTSREVGRAIESIGSRVIIVPGFIASDPSGLPANLGRGGSDYTAAILAKILHAELLEIWTDVDGYMTADPRVDKSATLIPHMTYDEAIAMSRSGAKVVYTPAVEIIADSGIEMRVRNTFRRKSNYTVVGSKD